MTTPLIVAEITDLGDVWHVTLEAIAFMKASDEVRQGNVADWLDAYDAALTDYEGCADWLREQLGAADLAEHLRPVKVSGCLACPRRGIAELRIVEAEVLHLVS